MLVLTGVVMSSMVNKDGTRQYVEVADRENFNRYNCGMPPTPILLVGEVVSLEIITIRSIKDGKLSIDAKVNADRKGSDLRSSESK
jgi:hypothetical protein